MDGADSSHKRHFADDEPTQSGPDDSELRRLRHAAADIIGRCSIRA